MIYDKLLEVGTAIALNDLSTTPVALGAQIDAGQLKPVDGRLEFAFRVRADVTGEDLDGRSILFAVRSDTGVALTSGSARTHHQIAVPVADMVAGHRFVLPWPTNSTLRYVGVVGSLSGAGTVTAGSVDIATAVDTPTQTIFPNARA